MTNAGASAPTPYRRSPVPSPQPLAPSPLLLALDTSTARAGIALYDGDVLAELTWPAGRHGSQTVLPQVERLLRLTGQSIRDLTAVAVALGPGSFSALRVGLSMAKGLAFALACPLLGVPTLDIVAYPHRHTSRIVWAVIDAGRTRVVAAPYAATDAGWRAVQAPLHGSVAALLERVIAPAVVCGEVTPALMAALAVAPDLVVLPPAERLRRPGYLAELAWARLEHGQTDDPFTLEPLYVGAGG